MPLDVAAVRSGSRRQRKLVAIKTIDAGGQHGRPFFVGRVNDFWESRSGTRQEFRTQRRNTETLREFRYAETPKLSASSATQKSETLCEFRYKLAVPIHSTSPSFAGEVGRGSGRERA